jgi:aspartyl-tRNA(Asn)/glutamyl-tRNA(Gln) amidotransferase subunit A
VGTDTCGSVRIPAVIPLAPSLEHAGPIARTVPDVAVLLGALSDSPLPSLDDLFTRDVAGLRVGVLGG